MLLLIEDGLEGVRWFYIWFSINWGKKEEEFKEEVWYVGGMDWEGEGVDVWGAWCSSVAGDGSDGCAGVEILLL